MAEDSAASDTTGSEPQDPSQTAGEATDSTPEDEPASARPKARKPRARTPKKPVATSSDSDAPAANFAPVVEAPIDEPTPELTPTVEATEPTPKKKRASTRKPASEGTETPAAIEAPSFDVPAPDAVAHTPDAPVAELTEATKRRRKKPAANETARKRTAASAKTATPRTRKTIDPTPGVNEASDDIASTGSPKIPVNTGDSDPDFAEEKPKRRTRATKPAGEKVAPKLRTRKPSASKTKAEGEAKEAIAIPDPAAPATEASPTDSETDESAPLVLDAADAIAEAPDALKPKPKREPARKRKTPTEVFGGEIPAVTPLSAVENPPTPTAEITEVGAPESALGLDRTTISPAPTPPTIIEHVAPRASRRVTTVVLFVLVGLIGLGVGWAMGNVANGDRNNSGSPAVPTVINGSNSSSSVPSSTSSGSVGSSGDSGKEIVTLTGSSPRQSAPFDIPSGVVQLHYNATGGTFTAKLFPESGGSDGTTFDCSSACDREQPISAPPGRYYFDVQSSGGDWSIRIRQ